MACALCGGERDEFVVSLAALALYDGEAEITADNINTLLAASHNTGVKPYWAALFAGLLKNNNIEKIVFSGGACSGPAPAAGGAAASAPAADAPAAPAKAEKPKVEEVDALDGGMDMFGGGGSDY